MRLLVTGGCGFIGSNFIRYALREFPGMRVCNVDALTYAGNPANLAGVESEYPGRYEFAKVDIADAAGVDSVFASQSFDAVVNFAAESHVDRSILGPQEFVRTNVMGTAILLDAARKHVGLRRFVQVSTDEVYGSLGPTGQFTESSPIQPSSPYSASKASADLLALAYYHTFKLDVVVTRCSNNYGRYQFPEKLIPLMIVKAMHDLALPVYGDGMNVRDWIHVEDHCAAVMAALLHGRAGEVYNVGSDGEMPNIEVVKMILDHLGKPHSLITYVEDRLGHDRRYAIDSSKVHSELGWKPQHTHLEGIRSTIDWYQANPQWWQPLLKAGTLAK